MCPPAFNKKKRHITDDIDHFSNMTPTRIRHATLASGKGQQNPNRKLSMASPSFIEEKKARRCNEFSPTKQPFPSQSNRDANKKAKHNSAQSSYQIAAWSASNLDSSLPASSKSFLAFMRM